MNPSTGILVSLKNTSAATIQGIAAGASKVIFGSPNWSWVTDRQAVLVAIGLGKLVGLDLSGATLPATQVGNAFLELISSAEILQAECSRLTGLAKIARQVAWNMDAAPAIVGAVRADMIQTGLTSVGTTPTAVLGKLQGIVTLVGLGMLAEAAASTAAIVTDGFLTTARLATYKSMLLSADAIA